MHDPGNTPETLLCVPNDHEAAMIVSTLAAHDVDATTSGEFLSGFQAGVPSDVKVLVRRCDLSTAQAVLSELTEQTTPESQNPVEQETRSGENIWGKVISTIEAAFLVLLFLIWAIGR